MPSASGSSGGEAIGTIVARPSDRFTSDAEVSKYLYCDGSTFSAAAYPKLYQILGTTTLPDLRERFLEGFDTTQKYIEPGVPNIKGTIGVTRPNGWYYSGAFYPGGDCMSNSDYSFGSPGKWLIFNASLYNPIYNDEISTVQPPAYTVRYYIRAK